MQMQAQEILLTTPCYPYPTLPANDSLTDATGQRFTKGDDIFTLISHTHCFANHILAQNIQSPARVLEYPRWEDFTAEVDRGYAIIGISAFPVHLDSVMKMCAYIRQRSPATKILLGSYAGQAFQARYDEETQKKYVDQVVHGEGVKYLRGLLGEKTNGPIQQRLMPKGGGSLPFVSQHPPGTIGFLVSGLGCPGGCDFCSTTALFDKKRLELLKPEHLVDEMHRYFTHFPTLKQVFVVEEDHFRFPGYLDQVRNYWMQNPEMMERVDWFGFGSIDHIGRFADEHGWEAIAELGLGALFIGVESKFAGDHGYDKRDSANARDVFANLHRVGVRTVGAWICGWDWHDHANLAEDLNYFVSLYPTYQQITRLSPFPGTALWDKLREGGRVSEVPWEDVHFWSGAQRNVTLEEHETLNLTEDGYKLLNKTWGPSLLRRLDVELSGYQTCAASDNPILRRHRALFFKRQSALFWTLLRAMDRYAPNGVVRRRVRKIDEKYRALLGEPTPVMEALSLAVDGLATTYKLKELFDPQNRHPKEEPFKRYIYPAGSKSGGGGLPYKIEVPHGPCLGDRATMAKESASYALMEAAMRAIRVAGRGKGDPEIDDTLVQMVSDRCFAFGF